MSLIRGLFNCVSLHADIPPTPENGMRLLFRCPGCMQLHGPVVGGRDPHNGASWTWNGDYVKPVFNPSLLVKWPEYSAAAQEFARQFNAKHGRYPTRDEDPPNAWNQRVCHSHIGCNGAAPGEIIFLADCTHALAGKTVPIPAYGKE